MLQFLKIFDFFPVPLSLKYKNHNYFRTWIGSFFTLLLLILIFVYLLSLFSDLINRENPNLVQASFKLENPSFFQIDYANFPIMVGLSDFNTATYYVNESIYQAKADLMIFKKMEGSNEKEIFSYPIPMEPCTYEYLNSTNISQLLLKQKWNGFYCLRNDLFSNISIGGAFEEDLFQFLRIYFIPCQGSGCASDEEIQKKLSRGYASIYFMDLIDDFKSFETPMKPFGRNFFTNFGINYTKGVDINFKEIIVHTDSGLITNENHINRYFLYEDLKEFFEPIQNLERFFYFELKISKSKTEFRRQYVKIQDILSKAGGLINIFFLLFSLIITPFTKITFYWDLLNECFNMQKNLENACATVRPIDKRDLIKKEDNKDHNENKKMNLYITDYFLFYFYKFFPDYLQQTKLKKACIGIFSVEKLIDVRNIIKKMHEIDKLKLLLLSEKQLRIFNNLPKPVIHNAESHQYGKLFHTSKRGNYVDEYEDLKTKREKTEIDLKLVYMMENKVERKKTLGKLKSRTIQKNKFIDKKKIILN